MKKLQTFLTMTLVKNALFLSLFLITNIVTIIRPVKNLLYITYTWLEDICALEDTENFRIFM